jgi:hypothetical protein
MYRAILCLLTFISLNGLANATSFGPYHEQRIVDANGRYYAVVKCVEKSFPGGEKRTVFAVTIAERGPGTPPVTSAVAKPGRETGRRDHYVIDPAICVRGGDIEHGQTELDWPPAAIFVSGTGKGIAIIDVYGFNNLGSPGPQNGIMVYSLEGKLIHSLDRQTIFKLMEWSRFHYGDGYVAWCESAWIDDKRDELVIVGNGGKDSTASRPLISMNLETGELKKATTDVIDRAIVERNPNALSTALELAKDMKLTATRKEWPKILDDRAVPLYERLQAAVLLAQNGDRQGVDLIKSTALAKFTKESHGVQYYALTNLQLVFGDAVAVKLLCNHVRENEDRNNGAWTAMCKISAEAGVPEVRKLMRSNESGSSQLFAIGCISIWGPKATEAVPDLIRVLEDKPVLKDLGWMTESSHKYAASALTKIGPPAAAALPILIKRAQEDDPKEWARVKEGNPKLGTGFSAFKYSENDFAEAICQIRKK